MTILERLQCPGDDARIMMRWWWFGPAIDREEIRRELTVMHRSGIGGVEISVVYPLCVDAQLEGVRNLPYLSDEFLDCVRYAAERTRALGMRMDITLGSAWPFGGPHIPVEKAVRRLRVDAVAVQAGQSSIALPALGAHDRLLAAVLVDAEVEAAILRTHGRGFRDGLGVDSPTPDLTAEALRAIAQPTERALRLPTAYDRDAELRLLVSVPTGQQVKTAAVGAEGYVLDHYDREALQLHLDAVGRKLLDAAGCENVRTIFCDSLEVAGGNWTPSMFEEFERRRGYDLRSHLPALFVGTGDAQERVRHDYGQTLTDMLNENFLKPLQAFAHANGVLSRVQAYGQPPAVLGSYTYVDVPEGEAARASDAHEICSRADWTEITPNRIASSAARQQGKNIVSAETWTWLHSPPFAATPLDMKSEADQYFLQGINRLVGHGWPYSPPQVERPGWMFYAAANFNDHNPWFPVMEDIAAYLQTVSSALSLGRRTGGVAIYLPVHDAWAGLKVTNRMPDLVFCKALKNRIGEDLPAELLRHGYTFDLIDDEGIVELAKQSALRDEADGPVIANGSRGHISVPFGYDAVILPGVARLPLETAEALCALAQSKPVVAIGRLPDRSPGHLDAERESAAVKALMSGLFADNLSGNAYVFDDAVDVKRLRGRVKPAVRFDRPRPDVGYVHRTLEDGELFFFVNTSNEPLNVPVTLRSTRRNGSTFHPVTRAVTPLARNAAPGDRTIDLSFQPFESFFVLMSDNDPGPMPGGERKAVYDLSQDWRVCFSGTGVEKKMVTLESWTASPDTRYYAGEAVYQKDVEIVDTLLATGKRVWLALSDSKPVCPRRRIPGKHNRGHIAFVDTPVKDAAVVFVNGRRAGPLWTPPYELDITGRLNVGSNRIEIKVYNRLVNYMASLEFDKEDHPFGDQVRGVDGVSGLEPEEAGLTGMIRLLAEG